MTHPSGGQPRRSLLLCALAATAAVGLVSTAGYVLADDGFSVPKLPQPQHQPSPQAPKHLTPSPTVSPTPRPTVTPTSVPIVHVPISVGVSPRRATAPHIDVDQGVPVKQVVTVPSVVGQTSDSAVNRLGSSGLRASVSHRFGTQPANTVITQTPAAGSSVAPGASVSIVVSSGPSPKPVVVANKPPVATNDSSDPTTYSVCRDAGVCESSYYDLFLTAGMFTDPEGDDWVPSRGYSSHATYGDVSIDTGSACTSPKGYGCVRYTPTPENVHASCYTDWVVFSATDPGGSGQQSNQYWIKLYVNCT